MEIGSSVEKLEKFFLRRSEENYWRLVRTLSGCLFSNVIDI